MASLADEVVKRILEGGDVLTAREAGVLAEDPDGGLTSDGECPASAIWRISEELAYGHSIEDMGRGRKLKGLARETLAVLLKAGWKPTTEKTGRGALGWAARLDEQISVRALVKAGADPLRKWNGSSPLDEVKTHEITSIRKKALVVSALSKAIETRVESREGGAAFEELFRHGLYSNLCSLSVREKLLDRLATFEAAPRKRFGNDLSLVRPQDVETLSGLMCTAAEDEKHGIGRAAFHLLSSKSLADERGEVISISSALLAREMERGWVPRSSELEEMLCRAMSEVLHDTERARLVVAALSVMDEEGLESVRIRHLQGEDVGNVSILATWPKTLILMGMADLLVEAGWEGQAPLHEEMSELVESTVRDQGVLSKDAPGFLLWLDVLHAQPLREGLAENAEYGLAVIERMDLKSNSSEGTGKSRRRKI